jgi:SNF2 family DNA or RNA helicase
MEQGLGKSLTTLENFKRLVDTGGCTRLVISCPNSFKGGWLDEIEKWGYDFDVLVYGSGNDWQNDAWLKKEYTKPPVLIINHEAIRKSGTKKAGFKYSNGLQFIERFIKGKKAMLAEDESIKLKDPSSLHTRGILHLAPQFEYKRILSGKPISQGPQDLWAQMRAIGNLPTMEYQPFKAAFCRMGGFANKIVLGAQNEEILAERVDPWVFRATKEDWTDLPPKLYSIREYSMAPDQRRLYKQMEEEFVIWLQSGERVTIDAAITKYIKLAQIQAGFIYTEEGRAEWLVTDDGNARLQALLDFVKDELVGKLIVVYNHKPVGEQLERVLSAHGGVVFIRGGMTTEEIEAAKVQFNTDPNCRFICITKSAKYGHTLLGDQTDADLACANMAFYENTYSLDDRSQLEDRSHRHGQAQASMFYTDFTGTPLDKNCVRALQRKENVFQSVFSLIGKNPR